MTILESIVDKMVFKIFVLLKSFFLGYVAMLWFTLVVVENFEPLKIWFKFLKEK